jgi:hypothetical protein
MGLTTGISVVYILSVWDMLPFVVDLFLLSFPLLPQGSQNHILLRPIWQLAPQDQARILSSINAIIPIWLMYYLVDIAVVVSIEPDIRAAWPDNSRIVDVQRGLTSCRTIQLSAYLQAAEGLKRALHVDINSVC